MKFAVIGSLFVSALSFVAAQTTPFYVTYPVQNSVLKGGKAETITWKNGLDVTASVSLLTGTNAASMKYTGANFKVEGSAGQYTWTVPTDLPQNATFSLQFAYVADGKSATSYSGPFTITGTTGAVVTASFVTSVPTSVQAVSSVKSAVQTAVSKSASVTKVIASSSKPSAAPSAAVSAPAASGAIQFKSSALAVCGIAFIASTILF